MQAAEGELWPVDVDYGTPDNPRRKTQRRHIERGALLLGVHPSQDERLAESLCSDLGLMGLDHLEARRRFAAADTLAGRGQAIAGVLEGLRVDTAVWARMAAAGHRAGLWGEPAVWRPQIGRVVFPSSGTPLWLAARPPPT